MGGADAEISDQTTDVLVEMAWFDPITIVKSSRRLGLRSEASARFEKGCDHAAIERAQDRFVELLGGAVSTVADGTIDERGILPEQPTVRVRTSRVNGLFGTSLTSAEIRGLLEPIGFDAHAAGENDVDQDVTIPTWRLDSSSEVDVIEEVARLYGYERIGAIVPPAVHFGALSVRQAERRLAATCSSGWGTRRPCRCRSSRRAISRGRDSTTIRSRSPTP